MAKHQTLEQRYTKYCKENKIHKYAGIEHFFEFLEKENEIVHKIALQKLLEDLTILKVQSKELDDLKEKHGLGYL